MNNLRQKKLQFILLLILFLGYKTQAQKIIQDRSSITAVVTKKQKGVVHTTAYVDYIVRRMDEKVMFSLSYSSIQISADQGYYYNGVKYGREVPGLIERLKSTTGSYPRILFDVYYGNEKQFSFTHSISAHNDLGSITGDFRTFATTPSKLENPQWKLVATQLESFNYAPDPTVWMAFDDLIINYERDKKSREEYTQLIKDGDSHFTKKEHDKALEFYVKASRHSLNDGYAKKQMEIIRNEMKKSLDKENFEKLMNNGRKSESENNHAEALAYYKAAAATGVNDRTAQDNANRVNQFIKNLKLEQEKEIIARQKEESQKKEQIEKDKERRQAEVSKILKEKEEEISRQNEEKLKEVKAEMEKEDQLKFEKERKLKLEEEKRQRLRLQKEEDEKIKKENKDRRDDDGKHISRMEKTMEYDPLLYKMKVDSAQKYLNLANEMDPYEALQLKNEWWDMNYYMSEFREGLNEPRRKQAWENSHQLLYKQRSYYDIAKNYFIEAIAYTDKDSHLHNYLLNRIKSLNLLIDIQKENIKKSQKGETVRQEKFKEAEAYRSINKIKNNQAKSKQTYQILTNDFMYPTLNSNVKGSENALQRQMDFENRLNEADQRATVNNAIVGVGSAAVLGTILNEDLRAGAYGNHSIGFNMFLKTGVAGYPVVANDKYKEGYIMESVIENMGVIPFQVGFDFWINRSKNWDIGISYDLTLGILPLAGRNNFLFENGGTVKINLGVKVIKLALEGSSHGRVGTFEYDYDVAMAQNNNPWLQPTDRIISGKFNYKVLKVGAGFHINFSDKDDDAHIRILAYAEKPSFYQNFDFKKPVFSGAGEVMFRGGFTVGFAFANNYPAGGNAEYSLRKYSNRTYFRGSAGKTWTLGKSK